MKTKLNEIKSYFFDALSLILILVNLNFIPASSIPKIALKNVPDNTILILAYIVWFYLFLIYIYNNLNLFKKLPSIQKKEFRDSLARWSRKKHQKDRNGIYYPQHLIRPIEGESLTWECKLCGVPENDKFCLIYISGPIRTLLKNFTASIKVSLRQNIIFSVTIPAFLQLLLFGSLIYRAI